MTNFIFFKLLPSETVLEDKWENLKSSEAVYLQLSTKILGPFTWTLRFLKLYDTERFITIEAELKVVHLETNGEERSKKSN